MAETQLLAQQDMDAVKEEVTCYRVQNPWLARMPVECLVSFELLDKHPLVMQQHVWGLHWNDVDGLFLFPSSIPGFIVDTDVFDQWHPKVTPDKKCQPFVGHDSSNLLLCQALFLTLAPLCHLEAAEGHGPGSPQDDPFVFSAMTVFVHPQQ